MDAIEGTIATICTQLNIDPETISVIDNPKPPNTKMQLSSLTKGSKGLTIFVIATNNPELSGAMHGHGWGHRGIVGADIFFKAI